MSITFRKSTENDKEIIIELIELRFGNRDKNGVTNKLNNRYLLAFDNNLLIAMTGLIDEGYYNGPEIDWTCIRKEYEGQGIIDSMFEKLLKDIKTDVYCSCWRLYNRDYVNLQHIMDKFDFKLVIKERVKAVAEHNKCRDICNMYIEGCKCYEDLYIRKYK